MELYLWLTLFLLYFRSVLFYFISTFNLVSPLIIKHTSFISNRDYFIQGNSQTMASYTNISYSNTLYSTASGSNIDIKELNIIEDWNGRPASDWSVSKIGLLQSKIEQFAYGIQHSNRYARRDLSKAIPGYILKQFANESFGFDGWKMEVLSVQASECLKVPITQRSSHLDQTVDRHENGHMDNNLSTIHEDQGFNYMVIAEAELKITLKDGTNTKQPGVGKATMPSKGNCFSKAKKEAINDALKKCLLGFEQIILDYNAKVKNNYFVDGLYVSKIKVKSEK